VSEILKTSALVSIFAFTTGCVVDSTKKESTADTTRAAPVVTVTPVNRGTHGMAERLSWAFSPDRKAVLVVADPAGVENEPVANGFFFGDEARGFQAQVDSVWDVAVSPDWKWIGFGRAYTVVGGEGTGTDLLASVSRRTAIDTATLRAGSFASSGMSMSRAVAQAGVIRIPADPRQIAAGDSAAPRLFPIARGWQVRWTTDGTTLALGNSPARATDGEPSQTWSALDPVTGALSVALPSNARLAEMKMTQGPTLDRSLPIDMTLSPPPILVRRGTQTYSIYSTRGVITITDPPGGSSTANTGSTGAQRVVGAGIALAATAGGRYIIALAPRSSAGANDMAVEAVVYTVIW